MCNNNNILAIPNMFIQSRLHDYFCQFTIALFIYSLVLNTRHTSQSSSVFDAVSYPHFPVSIDEK